MLPTRYDVVVVGAGFGGLATALTLAEGGARVALCEALKYPGGCASTFERSGYRFESGATLFCGLAEGQLFGNWIRRHRIDVTVDWLDPVVELRTPSLTLAVGRSREQLLQQLCELPGAPVAALSRFFAEQRRIADILWPVLDDPDLLPPLDRANLLAHVRRLPSYLRVARWAGRPLAAVLDHYDLRNFEPLRVYLDALCQITVQCGIDEAEAPLAMAAIDYYYRGTGHVRDGIGSLAWGLADAIGRAGGEVRFAERVRGVERDGTGWAVATRSTTLHVDRVVLNLLPQGAGRLVGELDLTRGRVARLSRRVADGWGAAMLYLVSRAPATASDDSQHLELIGDPTAPLVDGNHVFLSIGGANDRKAAQPGSRTITASTHIAMARLRGLASEQRAAFIAGIQDRMRTTIQRLAPEWNSEVELELTASPRTFARFTGRDEGLVGGVPRRAGLHNYLGTGAFALLPSLYLVGDSVLPGQSTLAVATGGVRLARRLLAEFQRG